MPTQSSSFALFLFTYCAYAGTFATYASLFFAERGMSAPEIGILMSLIQVMRILGPNLWGWVADHTQQRVKVLRLTTVAALVACEGIALGRGFAQLFAAMVLLNLFTSAQAPLGEALMLAGMKGDLVLVMLASLRIREAPHLESHHAAPALLSVMRRPVLVLHAATFAAHHSASVMTMQRWFAGPLQGRGQAL